MTKKLGVFCIEHWSSNMMHTTGVRSLLKYTDDIGGTRSIHRQV